VTPGSVTVGQEGVTLNAKWAIKTFTVKYVTDFGEAPQSFVVDWNTALETSQLPIIRGIKGATFEGWYIGNELIKAGKKVTDNITLTAKWTIEGAPVVYVTEHGENKPKGLVVTAGYVLTADDLPELTEEGWIFNGWYVGAKLAKPGEITVGEEGVTLEAEWEAVKCTITYVSTLGTAPTNKKVNWGTLLSTGNELQPISAEGNEFMGWVYNDAVLENGYKITGDMTVTAKWEIKKYQISYSTEFGTAPEPITLEYGTKLLSENLPELTDEGWNFKGWYIINGTEETKPEAGV
jgi:hypothetical protein